MSVDSQKGVALFLHTSIAAAPLLSPLFDASTLTRFSSSPILLDAGLVKEIPPLPPLFAHTWWKGIPPLRAASRRFGRDDNSVGVSGVEANPKARIPHLSR